MKKKGLFSYTGSAEKEKEKKESMKETIFSCLMLKSKEKKLICNEPM